MEYVTLQNGVMMPKVGFGVYQIRDLEECERTISDAIQVGYRLFDTAQRYGNEEAVGRAILKSGIPRSEFFITTKVWITNTGEEKTRESLMESMNKLQTDYLDLVLIHQPFGDYYGSWRVLESMYEEGLIRAIGVSNFFPDRLVDLIKFNHIVPHVNQIETHPFWQRREDAKYMKEYSIQHESWGPFAEGKNDIFENAVLQEIANKYKKSVAQVILRFLLEQNIVVIPKTTHKNRMIENIDVFDFSLDVEDMEHIQQLDEGHSLFFSHQDPKLLDRFLN